MAQSQLALSHRHRVSLQRAWRSWSANTLESPLQHAASRLRGRLQRRRGLRQWQRYIARRRADNEAALRADFAYYRALLGGFFAHWQRYVESRGRRLTLCRDAAEWHTRRQTLAALRALRSLCARRHTGRQRVYAADRWYAVRLLRLCLVAWADLGRRRQRLTQFSRASQRRALVLLLATWRQWAMASSRLREAAAVIALRSRRHLLRDILVRWKTERRLQTAERLLNAQHSQHQVRRHLVAWRQAAARRRHFKQQLHRCQQLSALRRLQGVLDVWRHHALAQRCRRRLVALFRRKHRRRRLRESLYQLMMHARVARLSRRRNQRRLRAVVSDWRCAAHRCRLDRERHELADASFRQRFGRRALHRWRGTLTRWTSRRRQEQRAWRHLVLKSLRRALYAWRGEAQRRHQRDALVRRRRLAVQRRLLRRVLYAWRLDAEQQLRARALASDAWRFRRHQCLIQCFHTWHRAAATQRDTTRRLLHLQRRQSVRRLRRVLGGWHALAHESRRQREALSALKRRRTRELQREVLERWHHASARWRRRRSQLAHAVAFHREYLLVTTFYAWQHIVLAALLQRETAARVVDALARTKRRRAVQQWLAFAHRRGRHRGRADLARRWRSRRLAVRGFTAWLAFLSHRRATRARERELLVQAKRICLRRRLAAWRQITTASRTFKTRLRAVFQTGDPALLCRRVLRCWRRYKRGATLARRADAFLARTRLRRAWHQWRAAHAFARAMRKNVLVTSRLLQHNLARGAFFGWRSFVAARRALRAARARGDRHWATRGTRHAVRRLQDVVARRRQRCLAQRSMETWRRQASVRQWTAFVAVRQARHRLAQRAESHVRGKRLRSAFTSWALAAHACVASRAAHAERFSERRVGRQALAQWRQHTRRRRLLVLASTWRGQRVLAHSLWAWRDQARELRRQRRQVDAAVEHVERVRVQRAWRRWLDAVARRRAKNALLARALSFYSTRVLQTTGLGHWRRWVLHRRERREKRERAAQFFELTLLQRAFEGVERYVARRRNRRAEKQAQDHQIERWQRARRLAAWQRFASTEQWLRTRRDAAEALYRGRRWRLAVLTLRSHASDRARRRTQRQRAVAHFDAVLRQSSWARWRAFVAWRRRYRHLVRLFRAHQLQDYLGIWREYVAARQARRLATTRALQRYVLWVYGRVLRRLAAHALRQRQKRVAAQHARRLAACACFRLWATHARVLRRMRSLVLFQGAFRLENHFRAWKRVVALRRAQTDRLRSARALFETTARAKCWEIWCRFVAMRKQEHATLLRAIDFRRRFFSRKYLHAWAIAVDWQRRLRVLNGEASAHYTTRISRRALLGLSAIVSRKREHCERVEHAARELATMKQSRAVKRLRDRASVRRLEAARTVTARGHRDHGLYQRTWRRLLVWQQHIRCKRAKRNAADRLFACHCIARVTTAWRRRVQAMHHQRLELGRFRARYFRSVFDDCFYRWKWLTQLKTALRALRRRRVATRQRQLVAAWRQHTARSMELRRRLTSFSAARRLQQLQRWLLHWESVATDRWIHRCLVESHVKTRQQRQLARSWSCWARQLVWRHARRTWRQRATQRRAATLRLLLHRWREVAAQA
ncbi:hypothetical protein P43SY_001443 [Pythium insidiosum]|uniref:Uncharacterized protein n=1 Tax=Pythium insidiosum TaxID=114742 RepID=A0AAD5M6N9_PYTIN|nr:hypothetical protein P43SY_001443 [Pythium insidiosum]